ncbi:unnamed protein product [Arabidopsis halleri]
MAYNPFVFLNSRPAKDFSIDSTNTDSGSKITDPDKAPCTTSPLPLINPSKALNEYLPLMSSPSRSKRTIPVQDAASNPSDSLDHPRSKTTETDQCAGSPSAFVGPVPPEVHDNIPSDSVPSPRRTNLLVFHFRVHMDFASTSGIPAEFSPDLLPPWLFATDQYPLKGPINSYSRPEYLLDLVEVAKKSYSIMEIVNMVHRDKKLPRREMMSGERRLRLTLIVIVEEILVSNSSKVKASKKVAEMVKDVETFVTYPWGRKSFKKTLEMVKLGDYNQSVANFTDKLSQSYTATHGFTLSFQLLALHIIPLLERYFPDLKDEQTFTDRSVLQLTQLKTYHNSNIFQTKNDPHVDVESIIHTEDDDDLQDYSWSNEVEDVAVDIIFNKLKDEHRLKKFDWHSSLLREVDRRNHEHTAKIEEMWRIERALYKDEIVDEVLSILREKGVYRDSDNFSHTDLMAKMNKSKKFDLSPYITDILNKVSLSCKDPSVGVQPNLSAVDNNPADNVNPLQFDGHNQSDSNPKKTATNDQFDQEDENSNKKEDSQSESEDEQMEDKQEHVVVLYTYEIVENDEIDQQDDVSEDNSSESVETKSESQAEAEQQVDITEQNNDFSTDHVPVEVEQQMDIHEEKDLSPNHVPNRRGYKRKEHVLDQNLTPLPTKRPRTMPRRLGHSLSSKRRVPQPKVSESDVYMVLEAVKPSIKRKFLNKLAAYKQKEYIIDGHYVNKSFFEELYTPKHWVETPLGESFLLSRVVVLDIWFAQLIANGYPRFKKAKKKTNFPWSSVIRNTVMGIVPTRSSKCAWFSDVDKVYVPMNWGSVTRLQFVST